MNFYKSTEFSNLCLTFYMDFSLCGTMYCKKPFSFRYNKWSPVSSVNVSSFTIISHFLIYYHVLTDSSFQGQSAYFQAWSSTDGQ